jgi:DNA-binding transcriptional LysR family regulator
MDLRQLEMFHAVAENSSFTSASRQLHVAQSAISRKVKILEQEVGERLFKRTNKRVFLTPAGEMMLEHSRRIFQEVRNAYLGVSEIALLKRGMVRIGSGMTACMYLLPPVLEKFRKRYSNIDIKVTTGTADCLIPQIRDSLLDLGVLTLPVKSPGLEIIPLTTEEMVVVTSPRHRVFAGRRSVCLAELKAHPMILFNSETATRELIDQYFQRAGLTPKVVIEAETVATIKPLVGINLGISLLPLRAVRAEVRRGELHYLRVSDRPLIWEIGLVFQKSDYHPRPLLELIALFQRNA